MSQAHTDADHPAVAGEVLRMAALVKLIGISRSTIYRLMASRQFPTPVKLSYRAVGWRRSDVDRWKESLPPAAH